MTHYRVLAKPVFHLSWFSLFSLALTLTAHSALASPEVEVFPETAKPGDAVLVTVRQSPGEPSGAIGDRTLSFYPVRGGIFRAVAALPLEEPLGSLSIKVSAADPDKPGSLEEIVKEIAVIEPDFPARELSVANKFLNPPANVRKRIAADAEAIAAAYSQPFSPPLFNGNFALPRNSQVTSHFGDRRVFNGKTESQHYGLDLQGKVGDPVTASNGGKVVLARDCYHSGRTIIINHGAGMFSAYFHLSSMSVRKGQTVKRGKQIGRIGQSGRVTGPHLHFGVKVAGLYSNPESVLRLGFD